MRLAALLLTTATLFALAPAALAATSPADAPAATPAPTAPTAPATATDAAPTPRKYGATPGVLLVVGLLAAAGGTTAVLLDEDALGYTGVCGGGALAIAGLALLYDRDRPAATADGERPAVGDVVVAPALAPDYVGVVGALTF